MTTKSLIKDSLIVQAQTCLIEAGYLADLIELAADHLEAREDSVISGAVISGMVHIAAEKLQEAMKLLDEAEDKREAA